MDAKDSQFTLRLEEPLRRLAKNPSLVLSYLARRHGVLVEDLQSWLDAFNGGKKELLDGRIDAVKAEVGLITTGHVATAEATPSPLPKRFEAAAPLNEPPSNRRKLGPQLECLRLLAENPGMSEASAMKKAGFGSWTYFKKKTFGGGPIAPDRLRAYLKEHGVEIAADASAPAAKEITVPIRGERKPRGKPLVLPSQREHTNGVLPPPPPVSEISLSPGPIRIVLSLEVAVRLLSAAAEP